MQLGEPSYNKTDQWMTKQADLMEEVNSQWLVTETEESEGRDEKGLW